jgi:hypothetical protein
MNNGTSCHIEKNRTNFFASLFAHSISTGAVTTVLVHRMYSFAFLTSSFARSNVTKGILASVLGRAPDSLTALGYCMTTFNNQLETSLLQ